MNQLRMVYEVVEKIFACKIFLRVGRGTAIKSILIIREQLLEKRSG